MDYKIIRKEKKEISQKKYWLLVYGRRKVGKTFLLRELCQFENYYTIKNDRTVYRQDQTISLQDFLQEIKKGLEHQKTLVIDEFQRLDEGMLEEFSLLHPKGRLILSGSSLRVVKKIFEPRSPLLGFFTPIKIGFIAPTDMLFSLQHILEPQRLLEIAPFLREPWTVPLYAHEKTVLFVSDLVTKAKYTITSLVGEVFTEEERELTKKYEAILSLLGSGVWNTKEMTGILYSRQLIPDPSSTHIIQYLTNLEEMELVESMKMHKAKTRYYRLLSPIMNVYYYLDSRYDISNRSISLEEIQPTVEKLIHFEIQNFIADLCSELFEGRKEYYLSADKEIDFIITKRNTVQIVGEVKWKKIGREDILLFKKNTTWLQGRKILFCKEYDEKMEKEKGIEIIDAKKLMEMVKEKGKN